jgi:hypothetical protein
LPSLPDQAEELWDVLIELSELRPNDWTLIGGQMVLLHALEKGATLPRISTDLDVLVNVRLMAGGTAGLVADLAGWGFELEGASPTGVAHRYVRGGVSIDVLAPEGVGNRTDLTTTPPNRTVCVPGGTQALARTELLPVRAATREGLVPRPSLLGALVVKAAAVEIDDVPQAQRQDFVFLLTLIDDPIDLASELSDRDRSRIRSRSELESGSDPAWSTLSQEQADRARAALRILSG